MANLLRMDLYRMFKGKMIWVCLAIVVLMMVFQAFTIWFSTSDAFLEMASSASSNGVTVGVTSSSGEVISNGEVAVFADVSLLQFVAQVVLGTIPLLSIIIAVIFCSDEFENGFVKNIFSMKSGRLGYFASKIITLLIVTVLLIAVGVVASLAAASAFGLDMAGSPLTDWAIWLALMTLVTITYELLVTALYWITRSKAATLVVSILLMTGLIGLMLTAFLNTISPGIHLAQYLLFSCLSSLNMQQGSFEGFDFALVVGTTLVYAIVGGYAGARALTKKDV